MKRSTNITSTGIKKVLKNYKHTNSFAEYIWNGFDAKASQIEIDYISNELGNIEKIAIKDNGFGINTSKLEDKFDKFYDSEKSIEIQSPKHTSVLHGKNGVGRLTFFTFAHDAEWTTCYMAPTLKGGVINISASNLKVSNSTPIEPPFSNTGTIVLFNNVIISAPQFEQEIIPFLKEEFCWFLELNEDKGYKILINGVSLDYSELLLDKQKFVIDENHLTFEIKYIQWRKSLNSEQSKFYYVDDNDDEIFKDFTTLNRKSDSFYHSVYIKSDFFDNFDFQRNQDNSQINLFSKAKSAPEYKQLTLKLSEYLQSRRKPFLRASAEKLVEDYETSKIFPEVKNEWDIPRLRELKETIIGLYEAQPKIFVSLNIEQKKTFVRFLNLLLDSNEREHIFSILEEVVNLDSDEREQLANLFKTTKLDRVISTIKLIEDRYKTYYSLKDLVFKKELKAAEAPHLQSLIENHYWLFGEEYHLVTAAEPKFNEALERYIYHLTGQKVQNDIDHEYKLMEMDIFACRQNKRNDSIQNIIVELKHPLIGLGQKEYMQVDKYLSVIRSQPEFNAPNMEWRFYLIGNKFDTSGFIERQIDSNKNHGEPSLVLSIDSGRIKFYIKTWAQIFTEFELKHDFIDAKLKLERDNLVTEINSANALVELANKNTAISLPQVLIP
jgi:hypothetical protein